MFAVLLAEKQGILVSDESKGEMQGTVVVAGPCRIGSNAVVELVLSMAGDCVCRRVWAIQVPVLRSQEVWNDGTIRRLDSYIHKFSSDCITHPSATLAVSAINALDRTRSFFSVSAMRAFLIGASKLPSPASASSRSGSSASPALRLLGLPRFFFSSSLFASSTISFALAIISSVFSGSGRSGWLAGISTLTVVWVVSMSFSFSTDSSTSMRTTSSVAVDGVADAPLVSVWSALLAFFVGSLASEMSLLATLPDRGPRLRGDAALRGDFVGLSERKARLRGDFVGARAGGANILSLSDMRNFGGVAMEVRSFSLVPISMGSGSRRAMIQGRMRYSSASLRAVWRLVLAQASKQRTKKSGGWGHDSDSRTFFGGNPNVAGDLFEPGGRECLVVSALVLFIFRARPGKCGLEHSSRADVAVAAAALCNVSSSMRQCRIDVQWNTLTIKKYDSG